MATTIDICDGDDHMEDYLCQTLGLLVKFEERRRTLYAVRARKVGHFICSTIESLFAMSDFE